jgi:hypothetical protein
MTPLFQVECSKCHAANKSGARFCSNCGERLPGSDVKCSNCGATVAADKTYCGNCGKPLQESAAPLLRGNRWARRAEDFATKVEVDDVEGFFKKGLIVEAGTKAIFFVNGAYSGILDPGKYDMGGLLERIKNLFSQKSTTAVLVDSGDAEAQFSMVDLTTRDPIRLAAECRLVVQMDNPTLFFENMMKGRQNYPLIELKSFLEPELRNSLQELVGTKSVQELSTNLAFKQQMEQGVAQHLATTFNRKGLSFIQVRIFDFRHPRMNALTNKMEEYWLHAEDLKVRLAGQDSTIGLERKLLDQETDGMLMKLEVYEDRARVFGLMRKAVASDQMNQVISADEMEAFLQGIDKNKLLRKEETDALVREFAEKKEDHELARRHLIQKLKMEQGVEMARAGLENKISLSRTVTDAARTEEMAQLEHEQSVQRKEMEMRQAQEWAQVKQQIDARRLQVQAEIDLAKTKTQVEVELEELKDQADLRSAKGALDLLKQQKAIKRDEADWDLERDLRARSTASEMTMKEEAIRHQQELAKIQALGTLSTEALIAAAPADRAAMLAELKRTEGLKGFSEEHILAMAAEKNSEVAKAFQEKFRSASAAEVEKAYERLLAMKDQGIADLKEISREHARMMQEMYYRGMDTQRDTATAATRGAQPTTMVITPGSGVIEAGGSGLSGHLKRKVLCPECHLETEEGQKFCDNCGHKFFGK